MKIYVADEPAKVFADGKINGGCFIASSHRVQLYGL